MEIKCISRTFADVINMHDTYHQSGLSNIV